MLADLNQNLFIDPAELPWEEVIFGATEAMQLVRRGLDRAVRENLPVLIQGESGTGKEVIAKYLHLRSNRNDAQFIKVNCVGFTPDRVRSQLDRATGLSSDANHRSQDRQATAGTLFLDEIGDMDGNAQAELIRLLSYYGNQPGRTAERSGMRIVCATRIGADPVLGAHAPNPGPAGEQTLVHLCLPALRQRKQDIPQLCDFLMQRQARRFARSPHRLTPRTLDLLAQWQWPGNLRELENWVARVVILGSQEKLAEELRDQAVLDGAPGVLSSAELDSSAAPAAQVALVRFLQAQGWSRGRTARELRMSHRALLGRLRDANVPGRRRRHRDSPPSG